MYEYRWVQQNPNQLMENHNHIWERMKEVGTCGTCQRMLSHQQNIEAATECLWKVQKQTVQTSRGESQWNSAPKPKAFSYWCHSERSWGKKSPEFLLPTKMQEKEINYSKFSFCPKTPSHEAIPRTSAKSMDKMWGAGMSLRMCVMCVHIGLWAWLTSCSSCLQLRKALLLSAESTMSMLLYTTAPRSWWY